MTKTTNKKISMDPIWDKIHNGGWGKYPSESLVRFLCRYKNTTQNFKKVNKILDIGCGGGSNTKMMLAEGFDICAIDGSKEAIKRAKAFVGSNVKFVSADFFDIKNFFLENYFDIICDNVSIYANTLDSIENILKIASDVLKKDGLFYSVCFSTKTSGFGSGKKIEPRTFTNIQKSPFKERGVTHFYTEKELRKIYGKFFRIESFDTECYTEYNGKNKIFKFVVICRKK